MRCIPNNDIPIADSVTRNQAILDIRIASHKFLDDRGVGSLKDEQCTVDWIREGPTKEEFATGVGFAGESEMRITVSASLIDVIVADLLIQKGEVGHEILRGQVRTGSR
jgi:hypothetical protein